MDLTKSNEFSYGDKVYHRGREQEGKYIKDTWHYNESLVEFPTDKGLDDTLKVSTDQLEHLDS